MKFSSSILCVDDNEDSLELLRFIFEQEGFQVITCDSLEKCRSLICEKEFAAIILDYRFGSETSLEFCRELLANNPAIPIIYYSAEARTAEMDKAFNAGADEYLVKPNDFDKLTDTVNRLIRKASAKQ